MISYIHHEDRNKNNIQHIIHMVCLRIILKLWISGTCD